LENTSIIVDVFILGDCPATNRNIRYNNGLPIVVMQYKGKVFTKLLPSNALIRHNIKYIIQSIDVQIVFLLQHVSVLGDHHQAIVMNEANTVIELFVIWIHISAINSCYKITNRDLSRICFEKSSIGHLHDLLGGGSAEVAKRVDNNRPAQLIKIVHAYIYRPMSVHDLTGHHVGNMTFANTEVSMQPKVTTK
jgi:hypothetical protein